MKEPYDGKNQGLTPTELDCKKIKWMVDHSPEWDYENVSLEDYPRETHRDWLDRKSL